MIEEIDFSKVVKDEMASFRARLLEIAVENDRMPDIHEYYQNVWTTLFYIASSVTGASDNIKNHFTVSIDYLEPNSTLVAVEIKPKTDEGTYVLDLMDQAHASFT